MSPDSGSVLAVHSRLIRVLMCFVALSLGACSTSEKAMEVGQDIFGDEATIEPVDIDSIALDEPIARWDYPDVTHPDGTVTRIVWMAAGQAKKYEQFLKSHPAVVEGQIKFSIGDKFHIQNRRSPDTGKISERNYEALDALMLTGGKEAVDETTDLIVGIQKSIPQLEIHIRVVEVLETDAFSFGVDSFFQSVETDPNAPTRSIFNKAATMLGLPDLPGRGASFSADPSSVPVLLDVGTITDGVQIDFLIRALKLFSKTDLLSAPHIAVLDGHAAEITAGEEIPFFTPNFNPNGLNTITTQFKRVGIKLYVTPVVLGRNLIRISLTTAVEAVTGQSTFVSNDVTVSNPIITVRQASTEMDVPDGHTAIIGGLITRQKLDAENKVPFLGEVPVLDVLFKARSKQTIQSNLIFFITPHIMDPSRGRRRIVTPVPPAPPPESTNK